MRYLFVFMRVLALGLIPLVGCGESTTGGDGGSGGTGGTTSQGFLCTEQGIRDAIAVGGGPHTFNCQGPTTVTTEAEIAIDNDVIFDGQGDLTVDGNDDHRVFTVADGVTVTLDGFAVTGGVTLFDCSGQVDSTVCNGGGIYNRGTLTLTNSTVSGNVGQAGCGIGNDGGTLTLTNSTVSDNGGGAGGGIYIYIGTLTLTNSTVSGNNAGIGGGIDNEETTLTVTNSTVSGNTATATSTEGSGFGGGIKNSDTGTATLTNSTVSGNAAVRGGGVHNEGTMTLTNSTLSGNSGDGIANETGTVTLTNSVIDGDCVPAGSAISGGHNIESSGDTCGFEEASDQINVSTEDLNLGPLQDNGGPTQTHALLPGSVAIDVIPVAACVDPVGDPLTADQRGEPRPGGLMCDVGAFEVQP
jgi:hypothetical protein